MEVNSQCTLCPYAHLLPVLYIGQFLDEHPREGDHIPWLLAYAHMLQHMGEVTEGRMWCPSEVRFIPQIYLLVDTFIKDTGVELIEVASFWVQLLEEFLLQDDGPFMEVISHLHELAQCVPTRKAWDKLIFPPPPAELSTPHQNSHLGYIMGCTMDLGSCLPPLWFQITGLNGEFICEA